MRNNPVIHAECGWLIFKFINPKLTPKLLRYERSEVALYGQV